MQVQGNTPPNYFAIDEAIEQHADVRNGFVILGIVLFAVIHAVRWVAQYSPMVGG